MVPKQIKISDIQHLLDINKRVFILMGGTLGAGKTWVVKNYFPTIENLDPDVFVEKLSGGNGEWNPKMGVKQDLLYKNNLKHFYNRGKVL